MTNLIAVNAQSFNEFPHHFVTAFTALLTIAVDLILLSRALSFTSAFAGFITMLIFVPLNSLLLGKSKILQFKKLKLSDSRIKTINELLSGIKVINKIYINYKNFNLNNQVIQIVKFYSWETSFESIICKIRDKEMKLFRKITILNLISTVIWQSAPVLVIVFKLIS